MKRILSLTLTLLVMLGCTGALAETGGDELTFCTIIANTTDYGKAEAAGAEARCQELGINHILLNADDDAQTEVDCVQAAISQGVDGIFIHDVDITALGAVVQQALDAGVQVSCASNIKHYLDDAHVNHELLFSIYWNEEEMGYIMGSMLAEKMGGAGKVLIIGGPLGANASTERIAGYERAFAEHEGISIVNNIACNWDRTLALSATEDAVTANPEITAIACVGEEMAWGCYEALENTGRTDILIATADGSRTTMQMCIDGKIAVIGAERAAAGAQAGINILNARSKGENLEDAVNWYDFDNQIASASMSYYDQSNANLDECDY